MTIKELKEIIKDLPDNMNVFIQQSNDEYPNSLANEAEVLDLTFYEDIEDENAVKEKVLVISDE